MSDLEKKQQRRGRWTKGLIIAALGVAFTGVMALQPIAALVSIPVAHIPVIVSHETRITAIEQSAVTNNLTTQYRFDKIDEKFAREDEKLDAIKNLLLHRQSQPLTNSFAHE